MNSADSQSPATGWLAGNGPRELELLFRAIIYRPSAPLLLTDNNRHYLEASIGASKLLGLPREKIIGRSLDDFAEVAFRISTVASVGATTSTCPIIRFIAALLPTISSK